MPTPEIRDQVDKRLGDLYERHLAVDDERLDHYYESGRGNYSTAEAGAERDRFAICLATVDGELYETGCHDWAFPLHSISALGLHVFAGEEEDALLGAGTPAPQQLTES